NITYALNYRNLGPVAAQNNQLVDTLPAGLTFVSASGGGSFNPITRQVTFTLGTLAANDGALGGADEGSATTTSLITAFGGSLTHTAAISTTAAESDVTNNTSSVTNTAISADVTVALAGPTGMLMPGMIVSYSLNYRNLGTAAAQATQLVDTLPLGLAFVS